MQQDAEGLAAQQAAEAARREAGKLGMKVLQQQMQVRIQRLVLCSSCSKGQYLCWDAVVYMHVAKISACTASASATTIMRTVLWQSSHSASSAQA